MQSGPYQGRTFDHHDLNLYCRHAGLSAGITFILFPLIESWDDVAHDRISKEGPFAAPPLLYWLERPGDPDQVKLHHDADGAKMAEARRLEAAGYQPPVRPPTGAYYFCIPASQIADESHWAALVDEKGRKWCYQQLASIDENPPMPSGARKCLTLHAETLEDLRRHLSDDID